ncbi:guanine deaminase [Colletotrichum higginsianum]|uniref:Guanine deaminase n=1 Tax=Colletotrichum higginsianum (strain IMI 349063) TaxID=759273 RepID=H1V9H6_COLHI|nr:guanine deaminase [Colletotrichum higginsianum]
MLDSIRQAVIASNAREVIVCCLEDKIDIFAVGKEFDAIWVTCPLDETFGVMTVREEKDSLRTLFEKFLMTGDDRNIARVYVQGKLVKDALTA